MKESLKNLFLIFSSLLLLFSFVFYWTRPKVAPEYKVIAYLQNAFDDSGHNALKQGMEQAALDYKVEITITHFDESLAIQEKEQQLLDEIAQGKQGVILEPSFTQESMNLPETGAFVFVNSESQTSKKVPKIATDNQKMGEELGNEILEKNEEKQAILILSSDEMTQENRENQAGLIQFLAQHQIEYEEILLGENFEEAVIGKINTQAYGGIVCLDRQGSEALGKLKKGHKSLSAMAIYGFGFSNELLNLVDQGIIQGLGVSNQFAVGYAAVTQIVGQLEGKSPHLPQIARLIVTKENLFDTDNQKLLFPLIQ